MLCIQVPSRVYKFLCFPSLVRCGRQGEVSTLFPTRLSAAPGQWGPTAKTFCLLPASRVLRVDLYRIYTPVPGSVGKESSMEKPQARKRGSQSLTECGFSSSINTLSSLCAKFYLGRYHVAWMGAGRKARGLGHCAGL